MIRSLLRVTVAAALISLSLSGSTARCQANWFLFRAFSGGSAFDLAFLEPTELKTPVWVPETYSQLALNKHEVTAQKVTRKSQGEELAPSSGPSSAKSDDRGEADQFGEEPADVRSVFLRQSSSLLKEGRVQWDVGLTYATQQNRSLALLPDNSIDLAKLRTRQIAVPITWRRGVYDCLEVFSTVPVGVSSYELSDAGTEQSSTRGGIGDVGAGMLYQAFYETPDCPDIIFSLNSTAPSGASPFGPSPDFATLGRGFWSVSSGVSWVKSYDPIVLYGSAGYRHEFERDFDGIAVTPAEAFNMSYGLGFAVNDDIALTAELVAERQGAYQVNGRKALGSANEPVALKLGLTQRTTKDRTIQPFVSIGLTDDAPQVFAGVYFVSENDAWFSIK